MPALRVQVRKADGTQRYYWRIVDGDDVLAKSETMHNYSDAVELAKKMIRHTSEYEFSVISTEDYLRPYSWHAEAKNSRITVAATDRYRSRNEAFEKMEYVRKNLPFAGFDPLP